MQQKKTSPFWTDAIGAGLIAGAVVILVSLVGLVEAFQDEYVIHPILTLADLCILLPVLIITYVTIRKSAIQTRAALFGTGALTGLISGILLALFVVFGQAVDLRPIFVNASPTLWTILMRGRELPLGALVPPLQGMIAGMIAVAIFVIPDRWRNPFLQASAWVVLIGTLRDQILLTTVSQVDFISAFLKEYIFAQAGLAPLGALIIFLLVFGLTYFRAGRQTAQPVSRSPEQQKRARTIRLLIFALVLISLPPLLGIFFSEILDTSGLFILMGLGLNIVVGLAGLLDLGYVAFYAIGAYTMGILTSPELGFFNLTFWQALPIALLFSFLAGFLLGLPVLRMRGDYLAIVTLGFGEIVRLLVLSDWLKPYLGGTQGIQRIAQPQIGSFTFDSLQEIYYLILIGIGVVAFIAWRLKDSRLGRSWMALREDEDVAEAMGINLVSTKLLAFASGAVFAGLAGTLGAAKLTSVYPHSMTFIVSINVLSLVIIGGMGSIPGVFVGALVLLGLPGVLTEFEEFRFWFYGASLIIMMLLRPEGLWPEERRRLELHEEEETLPEELAPATTSAD
jgi:branched-chain amino acid transport system permease protein